MRMLLTIHFKRSAHSLKSNIAESASATKTIHMDSLMSFSADQSILGMRLKPVFDPVRGDVASQMRAPVPAGVAAIAPRPPARDVNVTMPQTCSHCVTTARFLPPPDRLLPPLVRWRLHHGRAADTPEQGRRDEPFVRMPDWPVAACMRSDAAAGTFSG